MPIVSASCFVTLCYGCPRTLIKQLWQPRPMGRGSKCPVWLAGVGAGVDHEGVSSHARKAPGNIPPASLRLLQFLILLTLFPLPDHAPLNLTSGEILPIC